MPDYSAKSIVIIDDSRILRARLNEVCVEMGIGKVYEAGNGRAGLEVLAEFRVDLVICDWQMPEMSGAQLVALMKKSDKLRSIPIILISSLADKGKVLELLLQGVTAYIVKPFEDAKIKEKICAALG
jgi:two-component system, chemotaxis family, chemotaxis protein CheY